MTRPRVIILTQCAKLVKNQRTIEIMVAALFIATGVAAMTAGIAFDPIVQASDALDEVAPQEHAVTLGALLWTINNVGIVLIAVFMYPLLKRRNELAATGYLAVRIVEATIMMIGIAAGLLLIPVSEAILAGSTAHQAIGETLVNLRFLGVTLLSLPLCALGGLVMTTQLARHRLVPRGLAWMGVASYALILVVSLAAWFGIVDVGPGGNAGIAALPIATFEMILLPYWLLRHGFQTSAGQTDAGPETSATAA